jgi:phage gpG-like protein
MSEFSLAGFAAHMAKIAAGIALVEQKVLEDAAKIVETEAKRVIGTYDYGWTPLKPSTVARKARGDTPLLETGKMRESIEHSVGIREAVVGSNDDRAVFQELGTPTIPPRSFLAGAAIHKESEVHHVIGREMVSYIAGTKVSP